MRCTRRLVLLALGLGVALPTCSGPEPPQPGPAVLEAGQVMHLDPDTRRPRDAARRRDARFEAARRRRMNHSGEGLVEEYGEHGGVMVDLRGRFQSSARAWIATDGSLHTTCDDGTAPPEPATP